MNLAYISFSWQSYLKFEVNFQTPLNLKNPASQMIPQCQRKHTHIRESNTSSIQDVPEPRTKNLVLHGGRSSDEGHFLFLFLLLVILGQLLISCKVWKEGGSAELQLSQREQIWAVSWGQGRGLWVKMGSGGGEGPPEAGALSLTCIPQKYSHHLSWAETLDLCVHPPFLWLVRKEDKSADDVETRCLCNIAYCMESCISS